MLYEKALAKVRDISNAVLLGSWVGHSIIYDRIV